MQKLFAGGRWLSVGLVLFLGIASSPIRLGWASNARFRAVYTAPGPGPGLGAHIRGFRRDPTEPGEVIPVTSVLAYPPGVDLGANVAPCVDLDGTPGGLLSDFVTGPGPGPGFGAHVRGFREDGTPIPGLSFLAYPAGVGFGVKVACGDLDGDGKDEIITGPGPGDGLGAHVRAFSYDPTTEQVQDTGVSFLAYPSGSLA